MPTRGEVLRSCHHGHVGYSVSLMTRKITASKTGVKQGQSVDLYLDCKVDGWVPLMVADVTCNHTGTFALTQSRLTSGGMAYVTYYPLSNWAELTISCTVLYIKAPFIVSREYV